MKTAKIITTIAAIVIVILAAVAVVAHAAPQYTLQRSILPEATDQYYLGSSSPALEWNGGSFKNLTVTGTCTGCGSGGVGWASSTDPTSIYFTGSSNVGIGTTSPYSKLSVVGQIVGQNFVATSITASSTFSGALGVRTFGFSPTKDFQVGSSSISSATYIAAAPPTSFMVSQDYDDNGECFYSDGNHVTYNLYTYYNPPGVIGFDETASAVSAATTSSYLDDSSGVYYHNPLSWVASSGNVTGYVLYLTDTDGNYHSYFKDVGTVTSYDDDGCNYSDGNEVEPYPQNQTTTTTVNPPFHVDLVSGGSVSNLISNGTAALGTTTITGGLTVSTTTTIGIGGSNTLRIESDGVTVNGVKGANFSTDGSSINFIETGDSLGAMTFSVRNRDGVNGIFLNSPSIGLAETVMRVSTGVQKNIRMEGRSQFTFGSGNGSYEFQYGTPGSPDFVTGNGTTYVKIGKLGSATSTPWGTLSVKGAGSTSGITFAAGNSNNLSTMVLTDAGLFGLSTTSPWKKLSVSGDESLTGAFFDASASAGTSGNILMSTNIGTKWVSTSTTLSSLPTVTTYNGTSTQGAGLVSVVLSQHVTGRTAAFSFNTYQPTATTTLQVNGYVVITAVTLDVLQPQCAFTDETSTSRTMAFSLQSVAAGIAANAGTTGYFSIVPGVMRVKANTPVACTIALTTGTGSITYDAGGQLLALDPVQ